MEFKRLTAADGKTYDETTYEKAMQLYATSFPKHEQREEASRKAIMSDADYHFECIYDGDIWAGVMLYWETESFIYIEHLCIFHDKRNNHYGEKALGYLASQTDKKIILEIDPPVTNIALMRKDFYEHCGYKRNPFPHLHPAYHAGNEPHRLIIMSYPAILKQEEYDSFKKYLDTRVMGQ